MATSDLARWAEQNLRGVRSSTEGWLNAYCPIHEREGESKSRSFGFNPETGGWHCHGACQESGNIWELAKRLKLPTPPDRPGRERTERTEPEATYYYEDAAGGRYHRVTRQPGKQFRQARWNGSEWEHRAPAQTLPYRLPELVAADPTAPILWVEGEKDADRAARLGLVATTSPGGSGGAGKLAQEALELLRGRQVVVVPDHDPPGRKYARAIADKLQQAGASVRLLDLAEHWPPGSGPGKGADLSDWLGAGGTRARLLELVAGAGPVPAEKPEPEQADHHQTDLGNAHNLAALYGQDLRYCHPARSWYCWSGQHWERDESGKALHLANLAAQARLEKALEMDAGRAKKRAIAWALQSESRSRRDACLAQAASLPLLTIRVEDMDRDPWALNCRNGTLDLGTGKLREHRREDYCTRLVPVDYDPWATCPLWEEFLYRILGGDGELLRYVQCAAGYSLTGSTREQLLFILWGGGSNGKSTFLETLLAVAGGYGLACKPETFLVRPDAGVRNDLARLRGARLVKSVETSEGKRLDEGLVKQATGGDKIVARFLFQEEFEFIPEFKLFLATNHKPEIRGTDRGIWRRIRLLPFIVDIPDSEQDRSLPARLLGELPGILAWAVRGCQDWLENGLPKVAAVLAATEAYRADQDHLGRFLDECCVRAEPARVGATELYAAYTLWAQQTGERAWTQRLVGSKILDRPGISRTRLHGGRVAYQGIGLVNPSPGEAHGEGYEEASSPHPVSLFW